MAGRERDGERIEETKGMKIIDRNDIGYFLSILHDDGRVVDVGRLTFGRARITISQSLTDVCYSDGW